MITTKKSQLAKKSFLGVLLLSYLKKKWWAIAIIIIYALFFFVLEESHLVDFVLFGVLIGVFIKIWYFAYTKENSILLKERYYEIDDKKIVEVLSSGSSYQIMKEQFIKASQTKNYYLLYYAKEQFFIIDKNSFRSRQDKEWFEKEVFMKI